MGKDKSEEEKLKELIEEYKEKGLIEGYIDKDGKTILPKEEYKNW